MTKIKNALTLPNVVFVKIDEVRAFVKFINDCNRSRRDEEYGQRWEQRQVVNRR